jgi:predicted dehydrogenase
VIEADDVDIIHVCTPNNEHFAALSRAIALNKHLYVDKPLTASLQEAQKLESLLENYRGVAQMMLQYRFFPATLLAKQMIQQGFVGKVTHFRGAYLHSGSVDPSRPVNWKSTGAAGGGVIRDLGSHVIDLLDWLIGPMSEAQCISRIWAAERPSLQDPTKKVTIDVEDAGIVLLKKADGAMGVVEASKIATGTEDEVRVEIHGHDGAIRFNSMQPNYLEVYNNTTAEGQYGAGKGWQAVATVGRYPSPGGKFPSPKNSIGFLRGIADCLYAFLQAVAGERKPEPSLADGIRLQRVLEAIVESAASGQWVKLV